MILERFARLLLRRSRTVLLLSLLAAGAAGALLASFRIDPDIKKLFPRDDPTIRLTEQLQGDSPPARVLIVVLRAGRADDLEETMPAVVDALRSSPSLAKVTATREEFAGPRAERVRRAPLYFLPEETLAKLKERLTGPERRTELEATRRRIAEDPLSGKQVALHDPLGLRWIFDEAAEKLSSRFPVRLRPGTPYVISDQPALAFLRALGREDSFKVPFSRALLGDVNRRLEEALRGRGVSFELAGGYVTAAWQAGAMERDMKLQTVSSMVLVMLFLTWFTRSFRAPFLLLVPIAISIVCGLALGGFFLGPLTPLVASASAILVAQGIDFPVHFFSRFRAERRALGRDEAIVRSQLSLGRPFLGAATTTMAAFLMLVASRFPGFNQFGIVLFIGFALCLASSMTLFPVLLLALDRIVRPAAEHVPWVVRLSGPAGAAVAGIAALAGLAAWVVVATGGVRVDLDVRNSMAPGDPGQAALARLERDLGASLMPVFVPLPPDLPLEEVRRRAGAIRKSAEIVTLDGPQEAIPDEAAVLRVKEFARRTDGWVEGTLKEMASMGFSPEPFRPGLETFRTLFAAPPPEPDESPQVLTLFPRRALWTPAERGAFDGAVRSAAGDPSLQLYSAYHLPDHYAGLLLSDLSRVALLTGAAVVVLTVLSVGGILDGLLALVPVVLATGATLGASALTGGAINLMNMVAVPIIVGIGVDGGIHYMARFRECGRDSARAALDVGPGLWGATATTILGFGSIAFSATPGLASMGVLVTAGTVTSFLATVFLLPRLARR